MKKIIENTIFKKILSVLGIVFCAILVFILSMNLTIVLKSYIYPERTPDFFGIKLFIVETDSMKPEFYGGDLIVTKEVDTGSLKVGDIISFKSGKIVVTHRIQEVTKEDGILAFVTKGDGNEVKDIEPVLYSQVESAYLFKISKIGRLAMFMQTSLGMLLFVSIPIIGFIVYDIVTRKKHHIERQKKEAEAQKEIEKLKTELEKKKTTKKPTKKTK